MLEHGKIIKTSRTAPEANITKEYSFESFKEGKTFEDKMSGNLPAMGWNSWNAFGSNNTEELTKAMADKIIELGLDKLGYKYIVLDDGCYKSERVDNKLVNEEIKFPNGFKALSDYIHDKGLKFGMYNDIGTNLCAGSAVGTCGYENIDAQSYIDWGVDFLKVDNCYYLWDNATFSNAENARFTYAPNIKNICIKSKNEENPYELSIKAVDGQIAGRGAYAVGDYVTNIGTFDGTNVGTTPVGEQSSELIFNIEIPKAGEYDLYVTYATGKEPSVGEWLQVILGQEDKALRVYDGLLPTTADKECFVTSEPIGINLADGNNILRLANHRRQENVLVSYGAMFNALKEAEPSKDIILSICEWGKTQPHNWGYKVGNSWRILNDITFQVGAPGNPGKGSWTDPGTPSITSQYDKCVIMDEFSGLDKGWNDPDMLVIGMDGVDLTMAQTHMTMWCMMNSPLMLGMDLRRINKGDQLWQIISNEDLIAINQDTLGIQAKRVYCSIEDEHPDTEYITNHDRVDILAKPLSNGDIAVSFINLSNEEVLGQQITIKRIVDYIGDKLPSNEDKEKWLNGTQYECRDLKTKLVSKIYDGIVVSDRLAPCDNYTVRISIMQDNK